MAVSRISRQILADLMRARTGQHMAPERDWRIDSALAPLFRRHGIDNADHLVCLLAQDRTGTLADQVVEALLNNETYFFRDRAIFDALRDEVLPELAARAPARRLSLWCAGCSTGQEPLSLAILGDQVPAGPRNLSPAILATDISGAAIAQARAGRYSQFEIQRGLTMRETVSYFTEADDGWQADPALLGRIQFGIHNLLDRPPDDAPFDLITCRNVLLYFDPATRAVALGRLVSALTEGGVLLLGSGETLESGHGLPLAPRPGLPGLFVRMAIGAAQPAPRRAGGRG